MLRPVTEPGALRCLLFLVDCAMTQGASGKEAPFSFCDVAAVAVANEVAVWVNGQGQGRIGVAQPALSNRLVDSVVLCHNTALRQ